ncbi:glycosyltransferase family 2 protein [Flavobacterium panacagri]|uniref:glycosyltransferase family 2 protein n=1 Tax=Flavobacterium panacagri TaxID=3034146 RepID=UPI0025A5BABB|nr:glycosyltransferase family A protein [Flavobacterium panacagri]
MALISIIVPCFNRANYLSESLQSVIDQTYTNWECIIVNDGSQDETEEIAKKWCDLDSRFLYYSKENGGASSARNFGISKSSGIYILPLDSDDIIEVSYLEKALNVFELDETIKLVYCRASYFGAKQGEWILSPYSFPEILIDNMIFISSLFKKQDFIEAGQYNETLKSGLEDWDLWIRLLSPNGKVHKIPEILFYYRKHTEVSLSDAYKDKEKHNLVLNMIFDLNREIYNNYFGNPILAARSAIMLQKKIRNIENSTVFRIHKTLKSIRAKLFQKRK